MSFSCVEGVEIDMCSSLFVPTSSVVHQNQESVSFWSYIDFVPKFSIEVRFGLMSFSCVEGVEIDMCSSLFVPTSFIFL